MDYVTTFQEGNHQLKFQMELIRNLGHSNAAERKTRSPSQWLLAQSRHAGYTRRPSPALTARTAMACSL